METVEDVGRDIDFTGSSMECTGNVKMEIDPEGGGTVGEEVCCQESTLTGLHFNDSGVHGDDVNLVAKQLLHLDDVGNREEFHRQCCEVSCCMAKEVIQIMRNQSYKVSLLQITSESFLLQDLLNPTHYGCTEELLSSWLLVQEDEDQGTATILENINKMLALVESVEHLVIFLRSILKRFDSRFLGLCTSLALRALKQQRHLTGADGNQIDDGSKKKLAQTIELISQMYHGKCRNLYLSCLLTLLYVDPSDAHYFALETYFLKPTNGKTTGNTLDPSVDKGIYADLLSTVNLLRPMSLDLELDWPHLKVIAMDLLFRAGYQYEPASNSFRHREPSSLKVCGNWNSLGVGSAVAAKTSERNGEQVESEGSIWSSGGGAGAANSRCSYPRAAAWPLSDHAVSSQNADTFCNVTNSNDQTVDRDLKNWSYENCLVSSIDLPDSTSMDLIVSANDNRLVSVYDANCTSANGLILDCNVIGTYSDDNWQSNDLGNDTAGGKDDVSDSLEIVIAEDGSNGAEEMMTCRASSTFLKKRSASEDALSPETPEPSLGRSKVCRRSHDEENEADTRQDESEISSHPKRFLRTKDKFDRVQPHVTRKTFFFKYTFPKKLHTKETGKRSMSESEASRTDRLSAAKSKYTLPNGVKLKKCFIRLNRVESIDESQNSEEVKSEETERPVEIKREEFPTSEESQPEVDLIGEEIAEEKVVQCVCDGCGEVVPDCSWLTAHIVTCTGRPDCGNSDDTPIIDDELAESFQPDAPIWESMENREAGNESTIVVVPSGDTDGVDGSLGSILPMESGGDLASYTPQNSSEVDPANLMNLLQSHDNNSSSSSSFIYETTTSDSTGGLKVIQISNGSSYSVADQQQSTIVEVPDENFGKEIVYNGVYMYEFAEYQCNLCLLAFPSQSAAADHAQSSDHGRSTVSRVSFCCCLKCSIRYREKHIMWLHTLYMCGNTVEELTDESRFYRCLLCCKAFLSSAYLRRHVYLQHGRDLGLGSFVASRRQVVDTASNGVTVVPQLSTQSCPQMGLNDMLPAVSRLTDYRVGLNNSLIGSWYQVSDGSNPIPNQLLDERPVNTFSIQTPDAVEAADPKNFPQAKAVERNATGMQESGPATVPAESGSAESQALLDLACSIVLGGCPSPPANITGNSVSVSTSQTPAAAAVPAAAVSSSKSTPSNQSRRTAKGIMYKNVFMQCIVNYLCSTCKKDLSTKASKKEHKSSPCFDANSKRFTYLRQYSYLCPYCSEKFPSQKFCRQHQLSVCLQLMGVRTDELNHKQLLCPFCDRKYFNIITLKGHMTLIHKVNKIDSNQILGASGLLDELISYAPDGLSEKAKDAKKQVKDENERRKLEEDDHSGSKDLAANKLLVSNKSGFSADKRLEIDDNKETAIKDEAEKAKEISDEASVAWANQKPGKTRPGVENGHDDKPCGLTDLACDSRDAADAAKIDDDEEEELDQNDLHIDADADDLTFDPDTSNDVTSTDELSEFDADSNCELENPLTKSEEPRESHFGRTEDALDGKKSLRRKKSKKTRKKVVAKSSRKSH